MVFNAKDKGDHEKCEGHRECHPEWGKSDGEAETSYDIPYMWILERNDTNELIYKAETDSQT